MGIEKLIDFIIQFLADFLPFFVTREWQKTVVLQFGKVHRVKEKGIWWKWPFADDPIHYNVVTTTMETQVQSLVTSDDKDVTVKVVVKYTISDVVKHTTEIYDSDDAINDITQGHVMSEVNNSTYEQCRNTMVLSSDITKKVRADVKKYGVLIEHVTVTNFIKTRNYRLFNEANI